MTLIKKCENCGYLLQIDGSEESGVNITTLTEELRSIWKAIKQKEDKDYSDGDVRGNK